MYGCSLDLCVATLSVASSGIASQKKTQLHDPLVISKWQRGKGN